ncbi:hypothetical protein KGO06_00680 [Patescibacteria group bacterium]|nr:hypothetical protein [Patescibacteria group bacterium]
MRRGLPSFRAKKYSAVEPDEILIESANLPAFDAAHLEGRIEKPLSKRVYKAVLAAATVLAAAVLIQTFMLSVARHDFYAAWALDNRLEAHTILADRGIITDRSGAPLVENVGTSSEKVERRYVLGEAAAHVTGYVSYPKKDAKGFWFQDEMIGLGGVEALYNDRLRGKNGSMLHELDATGKSTSGAIVRPAIPGDDLALSIDAELQSAVFSAIKDRVDASFKGGAAAIMDVETGELYALASYPSYDPKVLSAGEPREIIAAYLQDARGPFVDRAISGLYTPGSIVKPFLALAALQEGVATPQTTYVSTGKLVIPNPYDPSKPTIFKDWRAHGATDMRRAIAVSSDVYFYIIGGGFESHRGLGISAIDRYAALFGFGSKTGFPLEDEPAGVVPTPAWKADVFGEDVWRVGDTYNTSIGQYGWQVTLLQSLRATAALANGGTLLTPTILRDAPTEATTISLRPEYLRVVNEGMRDAVTDGTAKALIISGAEIAAKTGTAETGVRKEFINSLIIGFFPFDAPKFAFAVVLERAPAGTMQGAPAAMRAILEWIAVHRPQMLRAD